MRIKVLHLGFFYAGGGERLALEEAIGLRELGHQVELLAPVADSDCYPELQGRAKVHRLVPALPHWLPGRVALGVLLACLLAPVLAFRLHRSDVVLAANQPSLWLAWWVKRLFGVPYVAYLAQPTRVLYPRQVDLEAKHVSGDYRVFSWLSRLARPLIDRVDQLSVAGAATVLANGSHMAKVLEEIYGREMEVCPAGAEAASAAVLERERHQGRLLVGELEIQRPYVLLTNRHYPQKRFELAIEAMRQAPGVQLVITGEEGPYTEMVRAHAREFDVAEQVVFTGLLGEGELRRLYAEAAAYVYPAPEEDYGMGIVEAMAHGAPVVAWRQAGPTSTVRDGQDGFLCEPGLVEEMGERLRELCSNPELSRQMGRQGWERVVSGLSQRSHVERVAQALEAAARPRPKAKIAIFHCGFTYSGGGERIIFEEALGLRRRGYEVQVYAPTVDRKACYPDLIGDVDPCTFLPQLPRWFPLRDAFQMVASSALVPLYAWRFREVDAILGANQPGVWIAWWVSRLLRKPYIAYLNQPNRLVYPRKVDKETGWLVNTDYRALQAVIGMVKWFVRWADRKSVQEALELLVDGDYIGDIIRAVYEREAIDCPAGCHVEEGFPLAVDRRFEGELQINGFRIRRPYVLLTNRHYPQKRFDYPIRALAALQERFPNLQLVIPGAHTSHTPELQGLAAELGVGEQVVFCGVIPEKLLLQLYEEAAVYVYPSPEEDFGMGVIESSAKGVAVVAWNNGGPTVTVRHLKTGYLAKPFEVADYAAGITLLLEDRKRNQQLGEQAHEWAKRFDWERHVDTLEAGLRRAIGEREQPELAKAA